MLEEINDLPRKVVENLDGEQGNIKVYLVQDFNLALLRRIVNFELDICSTNPPRQCFYS